MDRTGEKARLKQALDEIPRLRRLHFSNREFAEWQNWVSRLLESAYGGESAEYHRFVDAPGTAFIIRTEMGQEEDYHWRLDCYQSALRALIFGDEPRKEENIFRNID